MAIKIETTNGGREIKDGVQRYQATGLKIIIVGTGPGGLFTALESWRKGADVVLLDQADTFSPAGDFFTITPNALSTFKEYPAMHAEWVRIANDCPIRWLTANSRLISEEEPEWKISPTGHAAGDTPGSMANSRHQLQLMFKDQCTRLGIPFHFDKKVVKYEEHEHSASAITSEGERFTADIVVAADGIGSSSHELISGGQIPREPTGTTATRVGFPRSVIDPNSKAAHLLHRKGERPQFNIYIGSTGDLIVFITDDFVGLVFSHKDVDGTARESWAPALSPKEFKEKWFSNGEWDERILDLIDQVPKKMTDWYLTWRAHQDNWASPKGRVIQVGDAAHAFLPTSGNGATQAVEDGIVLGECFRLGGKEGAPISTKVFNLIRQRRVNIIQRIGPSSRNYLDGWNEKELSFFKSPVTWGKWIWGLKPEIYTRERYEEARNAIVNGTESEFEAKDIPPGYKHTPWTIQSEFEKVRADPKAAVKHNGYWGYI